MLPGWLPRVHTAILSEFSQNSLSIRSIVAHHSTMSNTFSFQPTSTETVAKKLRQLNGKKATGFDLIPPKLLKAAADELAPSLASQINIGISGAYFPTDMKAAQVTPVFKKKSPLDKANYRPVSILPTLSKVFEGVLADQLTVFFENIFSPLLSAFRKGLSCQSILIKLVEDWKAALDNKHYVGAVLMDLSKAFDCLPHNLLLAKLKAYGLSDKANELMNSYLSGRRQCVKIGSVTSIWLNILKAVPQGSILGPLLFNIFMNDLLYIIQNCQVYNYADDNTICDSDTDLSKLKANLKAKSEDAIDWFHQNAMVANPDKFQAMFLAPSRQERITDSIQVRDSIIQSESSVNILGIDIDEKLTFNSHINKICRKAGRQVNVLRRLSHMLDVESRLAIFKAFIISNFNYCPIVWHFCGKGNTNKMEQIQERALRFVFNDLTSSYDILLDRAGVTTLTLSRIKTIAAEVYKASNDLSPLYIADMFCPRAETQHNLRNTNLLTLPKVKTVKYGKNSLLFEGVKIWNHLPNDIRIAQNFPAFKNLLKVWIGCNCAICTL